MVGNSDHDTTYMRVGGDHGELQPWHQMCVEVVALAWNILMTIRSWSYKAFTEGNTCLPFWF